jgi:hypothetical protein
MQVTRSDASGAARAEEAGAVLACRLYVKILLAQLTEDLLSDFQRAANPAAATRARAG